MKRHRLLKTRLLPFLSVLLGHIVLVACASPVALVPAKPTSAASNTFSTTPVAQAAVITDTLPTTITTTIPVTEVANLPALGDKGSALGSKGHMQALSNADSGINQAYATWLATVGTASAELTPDVRAASPIITVTVLTESDATATAIKDSLAALGASLLAEAAPMLSIQLPIGHLDQLAAMPGVLMVQMPAIVPPINHAPTQRLVASAQAFAMPSSPIFAMPPIPTTGWSTDAIDSWANSVPIDWSVLADLDAGKQNHFKLADSAVSTLYHTWRTTALAANLDLADAAWSSSPVSVTLVMQGIAAAEAAKALLPMLNAHLLDAYAEWLVIAVPVGQIEALMQLPGLLLAQQPAQYPPQSPIAPGFQDIPVSQGEHKFAEPTAGDVVTEGVARSKVNTWHAAGYRGKNVRVAVLDSFDQDIIDDAFAAGELPTDVLNGPSEQGVYHGIAVAEIIHDMAPQATLTFHSIANAPDYCIAFANTLENLAKQSKQIISSSVGPTFCTTPGNGATNPITQAAQRVRDTYNTLYLQAAGNNAQYHFERAFQGIEIDDNVLLNDFSAGNEVTINVLVVPHEDGPAPALIEAGQPLQFYLRWDGGWPRSSQDYDLYLVYYNGIQWSFLTDSCATYPCQSTNVQDGSQLPMERIETLAPFTGVYGVIIRKYDADGDHFLDLLTGHAQPFLNHNTPTRSLVAAASYQYAFSIAAVDVTSLSLEEYSSRGPTYGPNNSPNGGFAQPQLAAYANVSTYVSEGFNGTSSATPHVAGAAAVLKSASPCLSARQLGDWLKKYALDKGATGYDNSYGAGVLNFPATSARSSCIRSNTYMPQVQR